MCTSPKYLTLHGKVVCVQVELTQPEAEAFEQALDRRVARWSVQAVALAVEPDNVDSLVPQILVDIDPNLAVIDLRSLDDQVSQNFGQERMIARLTILFGGLAHKQVSVTVYLVTTKHEKLILPGRCLNDLRLFSREPVTLTILLCLGCLCKRDIIPATSNCWTAWARHKSHRLQAAFATTANSGGSPKTFQRTNERMWKLRLCGHQRRRAPTAPQRCI